MAINIKNEETHKLAVRLAKVTGETMTEAITIAIRERLDRVQDQRRPTLADRIMAIAKDSGPRWKEPFKSMDHDEFLYDENGLPK